MEVVLITIVVKNMMVVGWMWCDIWDFLSSQPWFREVKVVSSNICILQILGRRSWFLRFVMIMGCFWKWPSFIIDGVWIMSMIEHVGVIKNVMVMIWVPWDAVNTIFPVFRESHMGPSVTIEWFKIVTIVDVVINAAFVSNSSIQSPQGVM